MITQDKTCKVCGELFTVAVKYFSQLRYTRATCSKECRYKIVSAALYKPEARKVYICEFCNKEFISTNHTNPNRFCSVKCKANWQCENLIGKDNPNWLPIKNIRPSNKYSLRKKIRTRDKLCQDCGATRNLQVHHVNGNPNDNMNDNLILLCKLCHAEQHRIMGNSQGVINLILANRTYSKRPQKTCVICNKRFQPKSNAAKCCSRKCAAKLTSKRNKGRTPWNKGLTSK